MTANSYSALDDVCITYGEERRQHGYAEPAPRLCTKFTFYSS